MTGSLPKGRRKLTLRGVTAVEAKTIPPAHTRQLPLRKGGWGTRGKRLLGFCAGEMTGTEKNEKPPDGREVQLELWGSGSAIDEGGVESFAGEEGGKELIDDFAAGHQVAVADDHGGHKPAIFGDAVSIIILLDEGEAFIRIFIDADELDCAGCAVRESDGFRQGAGEGIKLLAVGTIILIEIVNQAVGAVDGVAGLCIRFRLVGDGGGGGAGSARRPRWA